MIYLTAVGLPPGGIVSVTPHHKSATHIRVYEMKIQKSLGKFVEVLVYNFT
jgi:hypothetical protein